MEGVCEDEERVLHNGHVEVLEEHICDLLVRYYFCKELTHRVKTDFSKLDLVVFDRPNDTIDSDLEILFSGSEKSFEREVDDVLDKSKEVLSEIHEGRVVIIDHG